LNILYLCHRIPFPPDKGDKIRSFHQIDYLAGRHRLHVATFLDSPEDERHVPALRERCASLSVVRRGRARSMTQAALALLTGRSLSVEAFHSAGLSRSVGRMLREERIDVALVFSSAMAQYVSRDTTVPHVIDFVDADAEKWSAYAATSPAPKSWIYRLEAGRLRRYDARVGATSRRAVVVSAKEAEIFRGYDPPCDPAVITNGVDTDYFQPRSKSSATLPRLVFVGMMDYRPNADAVTYFAETIFPLIRGRVEDASFAIVGRNPSSAVRALASQPGVEVTGAVPDVRPYLETASVAVAPFRISRGLQNKVLEAMASGLPVVGTEVAFQGVSATPADGIEIADTPEAFAEAVTRLLRDPALRERRGSEARAYVERRHRWNEHGAALEAILQQACDPQGSRKS